MAHRGARPPISAARCSFWRSVRCEGAEGALWFRQRRGKRRASGIGRRAEGRSGRGGLRKGKIADAAAAVSRGSRWRSAGRFAVNHRRALNIRASCAGRPARDQVQSPAIGRLRRLKEATCRRARRARRREVHGSRAHEEGGEDLTSCDARFATRSGLRSGREVRLVQKYIGGRGETPQLSKLGGGRGPTRRRGLSRRSAILAVELLETRRCPAGGRHPDPEDTPAARVPEAAFPYRNSR